MALELVTGYQGKDHVTAEQWADFNRGIFGDAAILPVGNRMETAIQTANQISVKDGIAVFDGREVYIGYGESENIAITSGTQGMLRRDIVVVEYTREEETGIESVQFKVINGTPAASNAQDPSIQDMDIRTGVFKSQKPFCRIRLNGTAIEGVDSLVSVKEFKDHVFSEPVNNLTGTNPSLPLAAPQGKALKQLIDKINSSLVGKGRANQNYIDDSKETECKWLKKGNICQVSLIFTPLHTFGAEWILFSELPEAEQPQEIQYMAVTEDGKIEPGLIRVSGTTILSWYASQPMVGVPVKFGFTYITKS